MIGCGTKAGTIYASHCRPNLQRSIDRATQIQPASKTQERFDQSLALTPTLHAVLDELRLSPPIRYTHPDRASAPDSASNRKRAAVPHHRYTSPSTPQ